MSQCYPGVVAIMPAWNEEGSVGTVISDLRARGINRVIVADNASDDATAAVASTAGATVVPVPRRGYGSACLGALATLDDDCRAILFCDADGADDLDRIETLVRPVLAGQAELVVGSRSLGKRQHGALSWPQMVGNMACSTLMRWLYRKRVSDLGPFRCIARPALDRLAMSDPDFGWTAEMQVKAFRLGLRYREVPVKARCRIAGESKISGNLLIGLKAGHIIISTILKHHRSSLNKAPITVHRKTWKPEGLSQPSFVPSC